MHVSSWMTLWLEKSIEVPEGTLAIPVSWHLSEAHLKEDFSELLSNQEKGMEMASSSGNTLGFEVKLLELLVLPGSRSKHFSGELSLELDSLNSKVTALCHLVGFN